MKRHEEQQRIVRLFKEETGKTDVSMAEVVDWAIKRLGYPLPKPTDPRKILERQFASSQRVEEDHDEVTGLPYRVNHPYPIPHEDRQMWLWVSIAEANHSKMLKSMNRRREQMVGDAWHIYTDEDHWNRIHPDEPRLQTELDFGPDVEWRKNARSRAVVA